MTQQDMDLLLRDLSARLPYGVKVNAQYKDGDGWKTEDRKILGLYEDGQVYLDCIYTTIDCIKPYLRPMSSMTEEERDEYHKACTEVLLMRYRASSHYPVTDWLLAHHFDYRGLIEKELALEAPEGMYKNE
jgi:hypothetical protein